MWAHVEASGSVMRLIGQFEAIVPNEISLPKGLWVICYKLL